MKWFDGHCDTLMGLQFSKNKQNSLRENDMHIDLERGLRKEAYAQFFAVFGFPEMVRSGDVFDLLYSRFCRELEENQDVMAQCRTRAELDEAVKSGKAAAFLSIEGAEVIGCDIRRLEYAFEKGVRCFGITWNRATELCGTNSELPEQGLSRRGKEFCREAQRLGMLLDVSHLSDAGFWDVEALSTAAFVATHSNSRAVHAHRRNLTDDMFKAIRDHGGVVGLNLYADFLGDGQVTTETCFRHIEHFLDLGGESTVAMGSDMDGCERLPNGIRGIQDTELLWEELDRHGYPKELTDKLFYENWRRVLPE